MSVVLPGPKLALNGPADGNPSLNGAWSGHVNYVNFGGHQPYLWNA